MLFLIVPRQPLQGDPQDNLAGAGRPSKALFCRLEPFKKAATPQGHIPQPRAEVAQSGLDTPESGTRGAIVQDRSLFVLVEYRAPVAAIFRVHLTELIIFAQPLSCGEQDSGKKQATIFVATPSKANERAIADCKALGAGLRQVVFDYSLPRHDKFGRRFGHRSGAVFTCGNQLAQRGTTRRSDVISGDPGARIMTGNPVAQRHGLRHRPVHHSRPRYGPVRCVSNHNGRIHVSADGQNRSGFDQSAQDSQRFAPQPAFAQRLRREIRTRICIGFPVHLRHVLFCTGPRGPNLFGKGGKRIIDQRIIAAGLVTTHLPKNGRWMQTGISGQSADRSPLCGVGEIMPCSLRQPLWQPALPFAPGATIFVILSRHFALPPFSFSRGTIVVNFATVFRGSVFNFYAIRTISAFLRTTTIACVRILIHFVTSGATMRDLIGMISALTRPGILVRTAKIGADEYRRDVHLRRILKSEAPAKTGEAILRILEIESEINERRIANHAEYSVAEHVEVLIALLGEARIHRAAYGPPPST